MVGLCIYHCILLAWYCVGLVAVMSGLIEMKEEVEKCFAETECCMYNIMYMAGNGG